MRTSLTRALAGAAIAAAAALTAVGTAGAAGATVKAPTTLTLTEAHAIIKHGETDLLTGTLKSGTTALAGKMVVLKRFNDKGTPVFVDAKPTGPHGHVFFTVRPGGTTRYLLTFGGTAKYAASHSDPATVKVIPARAGTQLSIVATKTTIKAGEPVTISGTLKSHGTALAGRFVCLYKIVMGKPVSPNCHRTGPHGGISFVRKPAATTSYQLRFLGTLRFAPTHSAVVTIKVS